MDLKQNTDPKVWEDFITGNQSWNFLQSRWWGEILKNEHRDIKFWEIWRNKKLQGVVLLEKKTMTRGGFFFLESLWGPVWLSRLAS